MSPDKQETPAMTFHHALRNTNDHTNSNNIKSQRSRLHLCIALLVAISCASSAVAAEQAGVPNGSFEEASAQATHLPAGWEHTDNPGISLTSVNPRSGLQSLRIETGTGDASIQMSTAIPVTAGQAYRIRSHYRVEEFHGDTKGRFYLQANYHDADGNPIAQRVCNNDYTLDCDSNADCPNNGSCRVRQPNEQLITSNHLAAAPVWRSHERTLRPGIYLDAKTGEPVEAASVVLRLVKNSTFEGAIAFDDISLEPLQDAVLGKLPPSSIAFDIVPAQCSEQSHNAGEKCLTDADCGNGTCGDATEGFSPLHFEKTFSEVTGQGCGFETTTSRGWRNQGSPYPSPMLAQSVKWSTIQCRGNANQDYVVSVYVGGYWKNGGKTEQHEITVNDEVVIDESQDCSDDGECTPVDLLETVHFAHVEATLVDSDMVENKGYAIYDEYIWPRRYRRHDLSIRTDSYGEFKVEINGYVSGLVLAPSDDAQMVSETLDQFQSDMRHAFVNRWANYVAPETLGMPMVTGNYSPSAVDEQRGYVLFQRHWMESVKFSSRPNPEDIIDDSASSPLQITATPGEFEPVTFSIWPLEDLEAVTLEASDLLSEAGDRIPSGAVRTWFLQHRPHRLNPPTRYTIVPGYLPDWDVRDLDADIAQRAWLNIHVPEGAAPGTYRGTVVLSGEGVDSATLPLEIVVLPFELVRPERLHVMRNSPGNFVHLPGNALQQQELAFEDLWNHGFTPETYVFWPNVLKDSSKGLRRDKNGTLVADWSKAEPTERLHLLRDHYRKDTKKPVLWLDAAHIGSLGVFDGEPAADANSWSREDTKSWLKAIEKRFGPEGAGFEKIYLHATGEESHLFETGRKQGKSWFAWLDFLSDVRDSREENLSPHVFSTHTFNTAEGQAAALDRDVDVPALGIFHGAKGSARAQVNQAKANEKDFLLYGLQGRMVPGFYLWKSGATGSFSEFYGRFEGALNNDWDSRITMMSQGRANSILPEAPGSSSAVYSNTGRMIGSWYWEEIREGVDDDAYMNTLEYWILRTRIDQRPAVIAAREAALDTLAFIKSQVDLEEIGQLDHTRTVGERKVHKRDGLSLLRPFEGGVEAFDTLRREAAIAISELVVASRITLRQEDFSFSGESLKELQAAGFAALGQITPRGEEVENTIASNGRPAPAPEQAETEAAPMAETPAQPATDTLRDAPMGRVTTALLPPSSPDTPEVPAAEADADDEGEAEEAENQDTWRAANAPTIHVPEPTSDGLALTMLVVLVAIATSRRRKAQR